MKRAGLLIAFLISFSADTFAQKGEGKIIVEISKEVDGKKKTFKGEYNSAEEMRADPNYQEFAGEEEGINFWFDEASDHQIFMDLDDLKGLHRKSFHFFSDSDSLDNDFFVFRRFSNDSSSRNFNFNDINLGVHEDKLRELGIEMEEIFKRLDESGASQRFSIISSKRILVDENTEAFGKRGKTTNRKQLKLDDLTFFPNPAPSGKLRLRFTIDKPSELQIVVSNLEGKSVFSRYFENFSGVYSEPIDLSDQNEGIYLIEIISEGRRLIRKLVIE